MKNSEYWRQRFTQLEAAQYRKAEETYAEIVKAYRQAQKQLEAEVDRWYRRFAANNDISLLEARKLLTKGELEEFKWDVETYMKYAKDNMITGKWDKQLENASARYHISRLEALKINTAAVIEELYNEEEQTLTLNLSDAYEDDYYRTIYEVQKGYNTYFDVAKLDKNQVDKLLKKPWAPDGYNFSERLWRDKNTLINNVHKDLLQCIMTGESLNTVIDRLTKRMNTDRYKAERIVRTETAWASSLATGDGYEELGIEKYEILATLDDKTCAGTCGQYDGQVFEQKDYQAGVTAPPFHPNCRCSTAPHFDKWYGLKRQRAAKDENGKNYTVDADMKYPEWKAKYVDKTEPMPKSAENNAKTVDKSGKSGIIKVERQRGITKMNSIQESHTAAGNRRSPFYELSEKDIEYVKNEIKAINGDIDDFVFNSEIVRGTCFLASDGKVHVKGNIFPDESSSHPRDIMSVRAVLAHEYYGHKPYRAQYIEEDNDTSPEAINKIMARAWADEFRASYMAAKNAPNLSDEDRYLLIRDSLSRAEEAGVSVKYNDFIRRVLYG